jgi:hypothetical protein
LSADDINGILDGEDEAHEDGEEGYEAEHWRKAEYVDALQVLRVDDAARPMVVAFDDGGTDVPLFSLSAAQVEALPGAGFGAKAASIARLVRSRGLFATAIHLRADTTPEFIRIAENTLASGTAGTTPKRKVPEGGDLGVTPSGSTSEDFTVGEGGGLHAKPESTGEGLGDAELLPLDTMGESSNPNVEAPTSDPLNSPSKANKSAGVAVDKAAERKIAAMEARFRELSTRRVEAARTEMSAKLGRALKIALKRQLLDLEESPLKLALYAQLTEPQVVGRDSEGSIESVPLPPSLAKFHIQAALHRVADDFVSGLLGRAAELASKGDNYIADAETDLSRIAFVLPTVDDEDFDSGADHSERVAEFAAELQDDDQGSPLDDLA